jgi:hypothetical protein
MPPIQHFLLLYDVRQSRLLRPPQHFVDGAAAAAAYAALEAEYRGRGDEVQIVLVGADSLDTIKVTHSHYFGEGEALKGYLEPAAR